MRMVPRDVKRRLVFVWGEDVANKIEKSWDRYLTTDFSEASWSEIMSDAATIRRLVKEEEE
jgi:hypothetical protein